MLSKAFIFLSFSAIPFDKPNCTDSKKCITCMRCISNCPQKARVLPPVLVSVDGRIEILH